MNTDTYSLGLLAGKVSLVLYLLTLVPGICRRFKIRHRVVSLLTLYRRSIGFTMYVFAIFHVLSFISFSLRMPLFKLFGLSAFIILAPLFVTANSFAVRKLRQNWKKIHQLTYPALGLIFLHTALNRVSVFSTVTFIFLVLLLISFVVEKVRIPDTK